MNNLIEIIKLHCNEVIVEEDGTKSTIELREGIRSETISKFESDNNIQLPIDLKNLLLFSNGLNLFDLTVMPLEEMEVFSLTKIISFHNWGNGDFDCVSLGGDYPKGSVIFMRHSEGNLTPVVDNLTDWFINVIQEVKTIGTLYHPFDYEQFNYNGVYKEVYNSLLKNEESDLLNEESENSHIVDSTMKKDTRSVTFAEVEAVLRDPIYIEAENTIAEKSSCKINNDYFDIKVNIIKDKINHSIFILGDIENFVINNTELLSNFAPFVLDGKKGATLGIGFALSYAIYIMYLQTSDSKELLEYFKKIRLPAPKREVKEFLEIKKRMNL